MRHTLLAALALLALGCGRDLSAYVQEDTEETLALRAEAAATWAAVGVETPTGYALGLLAHDDLQEACEVPPGEPTVAGCSFSLENVVLIDVARAAGGWLLAHEVGHLIHGGNGHLQCDRQGRGPDLMCPDGPAHGGGPTARDVAFVGAAFGLGE